MFSTIRWRSYDFKDWLDNSYSFSIALLNNHIPSYGGCAHFSRNRSGSLTYDCPVQFASYDATSPTHSHSPSVTPVLVITNSDSHHDDPDIPHTVKACAQDNQINRFVNSFRIALIFLISQIPITCLSSIWPLTFSSSMDLCTIAKSMVNISWLFQWSIVTDSLGRCMIALGTRVSFQSGCACCCTSGGPCWSTMSNGTSRLATNAKFTKLPSYTSPQLFLSWVDCFTKFISILWLCLDLVATTISFRLSALWWHIQSGTCCDLRTHL